MPTWRRIIGAAVVGLLTLLLISLRPLLSGEGFGDFPWIAGFLFAAVGGYIAWPAAEITLNRRRSR